MQDGLLCDEFFWWDNCIYAHSVFQNMLLLTILLNVWHIFKWSLRSLLLVSCKVVLLTIILSWGLFLTKCFLNYIMCLVMLILSCFVSVNSSHFPFQTRSILICIVLNHCVGYLSCSAFFSPQKTRSTDLLQKHNNLWYGQVLYGNHRYS